MLNRTNRTLSANLNRLNLGTRSLAAQASANFGGQTLRIRHAHAVVMRDGMDGDSHDPILIGPWRITGIPGSSPVPVPPRSVVERAVCARVEFATVVHSVSEQAAIPFGRPSLHGGSQRQLSSRFQQERSKRSRKPLGGKRLHSRAGAASTADRAALATYAAALAATSG